MPGIKLVMEKDEIHCHKTIQVCSEDKYKHVLLSKKFTYKDRSLFTCKMNIH